MKETQANKIGGIIQCVEVYESKFSKRKYNIERVKRSPLIVGGVDIHTVEIFFVEILNSNHYILRNILLEEVQL
ncbi:hypothetical protein H311_02569 [Anncaliia algerae PRA109]|nr:hypothetical protein H311_02569 [Anncaliia algerae PRA109]